MTKNKFYNKIKKLFLLLLTFAIIGEFYLRYFQGFCNAPLYIESKKYEYIVAPNQDGKRFGNHYYFNSYSQRNEEPNPTKEKILALGDSILFGGLQSHQDSIATSLFTNEEQKYQMLNISAGSWAPDNCAAYLKENGFFNAKEMFLVVSSHDAHDIMDFKAVVGTHKSYPSKQYYLAWQELINRYLIPKVFNSFSPKNGLNNKGIKKNGKLFNPGFNELKAMSDSLSIPLTVYLHADIGECIYKKI